MPQLNGESSEGACSLHWHSQVELAATCLFLQCAIVLQDAPSFSVVNTVFTSFPVHCFPVHWIGRHRIGRFTGLGTLEVFRDTIAGTTCHVLRVTFLSLRNGFISSYSGRLDAVFLSQISVWATSLERSGGPDPFCSTGLGETFLNCTGGGTSTETYRSPGG